MKKNNDAMDVGSQPIQMTDIEKSFMHEIDKFLYWGNEEGKEFAYNTNVLEVFRKHANQLLLQKDSEINRLQGQLLIEIQANELLRTEHQRALDHLDDEIKRDLSK